MNNTADNIKELADAGKTPTAQDVQKLLDSGKNVTEIAKMYGVSRQSVYNWMKAKHEPKKRGRPPKSEEQKRIDHEKNRAAHLKALAENPDMHKKKEWSMDKPEKLTGGAFQSLERYCNATNEEISQLMGNVVKFYELGKLAPVKTDEECADRVDAYFQYIIRTGEKPSVEKLALALGVTRRMINFWQNGEKGSRMRQAIIQYAMETLAAMDAELVNNNKIPQVTYIFRSKNFFGMRDQTEVFHHSETRKEIDEEELRKRILGSVIVDDVQDAEYVTVEDE